MLRSRHLLLLIALVATASLLASGCGGEVSKGDYQKDVKAIGEGVEKDLDALDSDEPSAKDIEAAQKRIDKAASEIEDIDPPSEVQGAHDDLAKVLKDTAGLMGRIAPLMETATNDPSKLGEKEINELQDVSKEFAEIEERMTAVQDEFKKKDYDIGLGDSSDESSSK